MRTLVFSFLFILAASSQCMAGDKTITYFLDGARVTYETAFSGGYVEIPLPGGLVPDTVRVKPRSNANIDRLELVKTPKGPKATREIPGLTERKNVLQDRLKALETREDIFKAAAKSQSGRAPRKTKNNPEPMANIRKGTEFAISQLESVYAIRRKTEQELASLESRLSVLQATNRADNYVCRVWFSAKRGRARISYLVSDLSWRPVYDFRLNGDGRAEMIVRAIYVPSGKNTPAFVVSGKMSDFENIPAMPESVSKPYDKIGEYRFPVEKEALSSGPVDSLTFTFSNLTDRKFPAGYASCYRHGEYLGGIPFKGVGPKESATLSFGKSAIP